MSQSDSSEPNGYESLGGSAEDKDRSKAARENINAVFENARKKSDAAYEQAAAYIRKSPMEAVGYAVGVSAVLGVIVGMLMGRRD